MTIQKPVRIFEYPFFMAFTFAAFIVPQTFSLMSFPGDVENDSVDAVLLMACLCLIACFVGYRFRPNTLIMRWTTCSTDMSRLFHVGLLFTGISYAMSTAISNTDIQYTQTGGMTGSATIIVFFAGLAYPGFAILLFCFLRRSSIGTGAAAIAGIMPILRDLISGRRENTAILVLTIVMAFFYERHIEPRRLAIVGILIFSMLAIPATGQYRGYAASGNWAGVLQIDLVDTFSRFLSGESVLELRNGAAVIEATSQTGHYDFGAAYWNHLVFRYVPAQITGDTFKQSLTFDTWDFNKNGATETGYRMPVGSTITGMGDTFQQFGWLGCMFFVFMGVLFKSMWKASLAKDALFARLLYMLTFTSGMRAVTHWTLDFLPGVVYFGIFVGAAFFYAGIPERRRRAASSRLGQRRARLVCRQVDGHIG